VTFGSAPAVQHVWRRAQWGPRPQDSAPGPQEGRYTGRVQLQDGKTYAVELYVNDANTDGTLGYPGFPSQECLAQGQKTHQAKVRRVATAEEEPPENINPFAPPGPFPDENWCHLPQDKLRRYFDAPRDVLTLSVKDPNTQAPVYQYDMMSGQVQVGPEGVALIEVQSPEDITQEAANLAKLQAEAAAFHQKHNQK
jgi:hypothetical protein